MVGEGGLEAKIWLVDKMTRATDTASPIKLNATVAFIVEMEVVEAETLL